MNKSLSLFLFLFAVLLPAQSQCRATEHVAKCTVNQKPTAHKFEVKYSENSMLELTYFMTRKAPDGKSTYSCSINARRGEDGSNWIDSKADRKTQVDIKDIGKVTFEITSQVVKLDFSGIDPTVCGNTGPVQAVTLIRQSGQCKIK